MHCLCSQNISRGVKLENQWVSINILSHKKNFFKKITKIKTEWSGQKDIVEIVKIFSSGLDMNWLSAICKL